MREYIKKQIEEKEERWERCKRLLTGFFIGLAVVNYLFVFVALRLLPELREKVYAFLGQKTLSVMNGCWIAVTVLSVFILGLALLGKRLLEIRKLDKELDRAEEIEGMEG